MNLADGLSRAIVRIDRLVQPSCDSLLTLCREAVLRKYIIEYVTCKTCRSPDTELSKGENRLCTYPWPPVISGYTNRITQISSPATTVARDALLQLSRRASRRKLARERRCARRCGARRVWHWYSHFVLLTWLACSEVLCRDSVTQHR
jgi:hypothetical protein